ncbi:hypothetical protein JCM19379_22920 [Methyloparacoccus murrellii]
MPEQTTTLHIPRRRGRPRKATPSEPVDARPPILPTELVEFDKLPASAFVREPIVRWLYGNIGRSTLWRHVATNQIPRPSKIGQNVTAWQVGELRAALAEVANAPR